MPTLLFDEEFYYLFCNDIFNILPLNIIYLQNYKNFSYLSTTFVALFDKNVSFHIIFLLYSPKLQLQAISIDML